MSSGALTVLALTAFLGATWGSFFEPPKLPVEPKGYRLDLQPSQEDGINKGRVRIDLVARGVEPVTRLELDNHDSIVIDRNSIKLIRLANADLSDEESEEDETVSVVESEDKEDLLIVELSQKLQRDATYQLDIQFEGTLTDDPSKPIYYGTYTDKTTEEKRPFIVLSPELNKAREVFPCFDKPFIKSWFELSVTHDREMTALSNVPIEETSNSTKDGSMVRSQFTRTPSMTLHSLGLFVSEFKMPQVEFGQTEGIKIGLWGRPDFVSTLHKAQQLLPSVLVSLELYLSRPYPLPQLNLVALPGYTEDKPKNSWGLQWFKESDLMQGNNYWLSHRLAKSAAMQWLSHLASPVNESSITNGLANFLATNVAKQLEPTVYNWNLISFHTLVLELGKPWNYALDDGQYQVLMETKVALLMQMFEAVFGQNTFKQSIQNFLAKKEFRSYSDEDLWQVITEQAWTDKKLSSSLSLGDVINQWLQKRIPLVTMSTNLATNATTFTQEEFVDNLENTWSKTVKKEGVEKQTGWWLPLIGTDSPTSSEIPLLSWLKPEQHSYTHQTTSPNSVVVINPGSLGPYLVNYDTEGWHKLGDRVRSYNSTVRAQLLHDCLTLALSGHLNTVTALQFAFFLKTEQSPEVWRTFYPLAERLRKRFQGTEAAASLDEYIKALLIPVLDALGGEEDKVTWKTDLRIKTHHLLCEIGFSPCVDTARSIYALWLNSTHPDDGMPIANAYLCPVMAWGTLDEWNFAFNRLSNFPKNRSRSERTFLMKTIAGCPRDAKKYERLLEAVFLDDSQNVSFSNEDKFVILTAIGGESVGYEALFNFMKNNWDALKKRLDKNLWEYLMQTAMGNFRTQEGLDQVKELVKEKEVGEDSVARVESRVKWSLESTTAVQNWLNTTMLPWPPQKFTFQHLVLSH